MRILATRDCPSLRRDSILRVVRMVQTGDTSKKIPLFVKRASPLYQHVTRIIVIAHMAVATRSTSKAGNKAVNATASKTRSSATSASKAVKKASPGIGPEKTADGHHIIVNNRKWRATDPLIPTDEFEELKHYLAKGRSGVRGKKSEEDEKVKLARKRTGLAKLGLGERGKPEWWLDSEEGRKKRWEDALAELRKLGE